MKKIIRKHWPLLLLLGFHLLVNLLWLILDNTPPAWDQAAHIRSAVMANQWLSGELRISFVRLIKNFYAYPPLPYFLGAIWAFFTGIGIDQISFLGTLFLIISIIGLYVLVLEFWGQKRALAAAAIFSFMPVIYDISRDFLLDLSLTGWVVWGLWFWLKSEYLKKEKWIWGWWAALVLASFTKLSGFFYFIPMGIIALFKSLKNKDKKQILRLILGGVVWLLIVGCWWALNWGNIQHNIGLASQGEPITDPTNILSWQTWIHYFRLFIQHQLQPIPGLIFIVLLFSWLGRWGQENFKKVGKYLTVWLGALYFLFTLIHNKDFRYIMPLLSVAAIIMAVEIFRMKKELQTMVAWMLIIFWGVIFINNSFAWPISQRTVFASKTFVLGDLEWLGLDDYPVRPARLASWPNQEIVKKIYQISIAKGRQSCLMVVNWAQINDNNFRLQRDLLSSKGERLLDFHSTAPGQEFGSDQEIENYISGYTLAIVPEQGVEPAPFYGFNLQSLRQARDWLWNHPEKWKKEAEYLLPNKQKIYLFSRF